MGRNGNFRTGLILGFAAYVMWGVLPLYFKLIASLHPTEIVAHRVVWSVVFVAILASLLGRWKAIMAAVRTPRLLAMLFLSASLIAGNWLVYVWAVLNGHVLEASLGYFLNPLVNVLFGVVLLKERLTRAQVAAVALASLGVAVLAVGAFSTLWISLSLATTFALYGYLRKVAPVDSLEGLAIETVLLAPLALGWLLWLGYQGEGGFPGDTATTILVILAGVVTAIPLLLFAGAAKRLPLSTLGFLQYVGPSLQLMLAVLVFKEKITTAHMLSFAAIWPACLIFAVDSVRSSRAAARARMEAGRKAACVEPCGVP